MVKGPGRMPAKGVQPGFFMGPPTSMKKEEAMKVKEKGIVAYRRRCRQLGKNTGLSHYILLAPKAKKG